MFTLLHLATLGQPDAQLFSALAREAERRAGNFNPQERANTAWAFATLGQPDSQLFSALAREAESKRWPPSWSANKKATQSKS